MIRRKGGNMGDAHHLQDRRHEMTALEKTSKDDLLTVGVIVGSVFAAIFFVAVTQFVPAWADDSARFVGRALSSAESGYHFDVDRELR